MEKLNEDLSFMTFMVTKNSYVFNKIKIFNTERPFAKKKFSFWDIDKRKPAGGFEGKAFDLREQSVLFLR